jgi:hypothetical protein
MTKLEIAHYNLLTSLTGYMREDIALYGCPILVTGLINIITAQIVKIYLYNYNLV